MCCDLNTILHATEGSRQPAAADAAVTAAAVPFVSLQSALPDHCPGALGAEGRRGREGRDRQRQKSLGSTHFHAGLGGPVR